MIVQIAAILRGFPGYEFAWGGVSAAFGKFHVIYSECEQVPNNSVLLSLPKLIIALFRLFMTLLSMKKTTKTWARHSLI